jgi:hypothetical protein
VKLGPKARRVLQAAPLAALVAFFVVVGIRGVDFGTHWDEASTQIEPTRNMIASGVLLPRIYNYPTFAKWLVLLPAVPTAVQACLGPDGGLRKLQLKVVEVMQKAQYLLAVRRLFIVLSALTIVWVYATARALGRRRWEAFAAAAAIGLSWEYGYQARWVTADCILAQFAALTMLAAALALRRVARVWLWLCVGAVAAGLGTGTKYQGVILLLPVMLASVVTAPRLPVLVHVRRLALLCGIAFVVYLATTPGTLLDPFTFAEALHSQSETYRNGYYGYTSTGALDHLRQVLTYFAVSFFSPHLPIAIVLFAGTVAGGVFWWRGDRRTGAVFISLPVVFLVLFCAYYRAVLVRNYLFLGPFLALLAARGLAEVFQRLRWRWARWSLAGALAVALVVQTSWLAAAAEGIRHVDQPAYVQQAIAYVGAHPQIRFKLSPQVESLARAQKLTLPPNLTADPRQAQELVLFAHVDRPVERGWNANDPWMARAVFGPREVDWPYYPSWGGHDRVVVMTVEKAKLSNAPLSR